MWILPVGYGFNSGKVCGLSIDRGMNASMSILAGAGAKPVGINTWDDSASAAQHAPKTA